MSQERILLVEDDPHLRLAMGRYLQMHDYDLAEAASCSGAESAFRAQRPEQLAASARS